MARATASRLNVRVNELVAAEQVGPSGASAVAVEWGKRTANDGVERVQVARQLLLLGGAGELLVAAKLVG